MEDTNDDCAVVAQKKPFILFRLIQWAMAAFFALLTLALLIELRKLNLPDAPVVLFWATLAALAMIAAVHSPLIFFRLPRKAKLAAYGAILGGCILLGTYINRMEAVWSRTAEGAKEIAERRAAERKAEADRAARKSAEKALAEAAEIAQNVKDLQSSLERCFSWDHQLSQFNEQVQTNLHNPDAFEHVRTELIIPDDEGRNVAMTFRAENGFGAIRLAHVPATLHPEDCSVTDMGEPE